MPHDLLPKDRRNLEAEPRPSRADQGKRRGHTKERSEEPEGAQSETRNKRAQKTKGQSFAVAAVAAVVAVAAAQWPGGRCGRSAVSQRTAAGEERATAEGRGREPPPIPIGGIERLAGLAVVPRLTAAMLAASHSQATLFASLTFDHQLPMAITRGRRSAIRHCQWQSRHTRRNTASPFQKPENETGATKGLVRKGYRGNLRSAVSSYEVRGKVRGEARGE